jgi:hypothetical protein
MRFAGTLPWSKESGGYEFELTDGTAVHLHDTDLLSAAYDRSTADLTLFFRYDPRYATGLLQAAPIIRMTFKSSLILEWEADFTLPGVVEPTGDLNLSVTALDFDGINTVVLESGPITIRFETNEVHVDVLPEHRVEVPAK